MANNGRITPHQKRALDWVGRGGVYEYTPKDGSSRFWRSDRDGGLPGVSLNSLVRRGLVHLGDRTDDGDCWRRTADITPAGWTAQQNAPETKPVKRAKPHDLTRYQLGILQAVADGKVSKPNRRYANWWIVDPDRDSGHRALGSAMDALERRELVEEGRPGERYTPAVLTTAGETILAAARAAKSLTKH